MRRIGTFAIAGVAILATSTYAGEEMPAFDGVGSMVLDMADEPVVETIGQTEGSASGGECRESNDAFRERMAEMNAEFARRFESSKMSLGQIDMRQFEELAEQLAQQHVANVENVAALEMAAHANSKALRTIGQQAAAKAFEQKRETLRIQMAHVQDKATRAALHKAERALRLAKEALQHQQ